MIYFDDATHEQLLTIALYEDCPLDNKYETVRELQQRRLKHNLTMGG